MFPYTEIRMGCLGNASFCRKVHKKIRSVATENSRMEKTDYSLAEPKAKILFTVWSTLKLINTCFYNILIYYYSFRRR